MKAKRADQGMREQRGKEYSENQIKPHGLEGNQVTRCQDASARARAESPHSPEVMSGSVTCLGLKSSEL